MVIMTQGCSQIAYIVYCIFFVITLLNRKFGSLKTKKSNPLTYLRILPQEAFELTHVAIDRKASIDMQCTSFRAGAHMQACAEHVTQGTPTRLLPHDNTVVRPHHKTRQTRRAARGKLQLVAEAAQESVVEVICPP